MQTLTNGDDFAHLRQKWSAVLDHPDLPKIKDIHRKNVTASLLENTSIALKDARGANHHNSLVALQEAGVPVNAMAASSSTASDGSVDTYDPILISLIRRAMPNLITYDIMGTQAMTGPTGLIFAMRARYANQTGVETFYNEVNTAYSTVVAGNSRIGQSHTGTIPGQTNTTVMANTAGYNFGEAMSRAQAEALGTDSNTAFPEMSFSIEKLTATAKSRALRASYTLELAQDLKAIHGLDAEAELSNMLSAEIIAEINREMIRTVNIIAKVGCQVDTTTAGIFDLDTDSDVRWSVEKFKGLMFQIEREANQIAKDTRRGRGNIIICSSDVASALQMAGKLDYTPALDGNGNLEIDDTAAVFAGVLNGKYKVFIDQYAIGGNYLTIGYKGTHPWDAGMFYCPYQPLQMLRAVDPISYDPSFAFKTRYAKIANPFAQGVYTNAITDGTNGLSVNSNVYYRKSLIAHLL